MMSASANCHSGNQGRADPPQAASSSQPVDARPTKLGHAAPGHAAPGHAAPGHAAPGHAAPGHAAPGHATKSAQSAQPVRLRALFLEDNADDAELIALELTQFGYDLDWVRVETEEAFVANLVRSWDVILTDFNLPQFDALTALRHVKRLNLDTPVIVVSGAIGEEQAVTAIHAGAVDYINKNYRGRLGAAVRNALSRQRLARNQREAQRELARREQQYRSLFEQNPDAIFALDPDGNFTEANASLLRLTGYDADILPTISFQSMVVPDDFEMVVRHFSTTLAGTPQTFEMRGVRADGSRFDARVTNLPIVVNDDIVGVYGIAKDITARKEREREQAAIVAIAEALRTCETRAEILRAVLDVLQELFGDANVIFSRIDPETHDIIVEEGVGKGKLWVGQKIPSPKSGTDSLVRDGRPFIKQRGRDYARTRHPADRVDWDKEPDFSMVGIPVRAQAEVLGALWLSRGEPFREQDVELLTTVSSMLGTALQRTAYAAQTEQFLRQTQEQARHMQRIIDTVPEAVLVLDHENRILQANRFAHHVLPLLGQARTGDVMDGLGAQVCAQAIGAEQADGDWHELILSGGVVFEYAMRELETTGASTAASTAGEPSQLLVLRDVSEERRRQEAIQSQERLATVGQLAAGIAHDFNNILAVISLYSGSLLKNPDLPKRTQYLETIGRQTQHAAALIAQILDFSRRSHIELTALNMSDFLLDMVRLLRRTLPENIEIRLSVERDSLPVLVDATRMQQVLMNLALNARDAMPFGGQLIFGLRAWHSDTDYGVPLDATLPAGEWVVLTVQDSGTGIAPKHLPRIFEPFYTTKELGKGTGLGLAQVYGIVKQHNGEIDVQSELNEGTTFTLFLPYATSVVQETNSPVSSAPDANTELRNVLLVEDNPEAMNAIYDILHEELGYHVHCAMSGADALHLFEEHGNAIDLILCDVVLPETDGIALYNAMCALARAEPHTGSSEAQTSLHGHNLTENNPAKKNPTVKDPPVKMILMSGYPLTDDALVLVEQGAVGWIQKPFTPDELLARIHAVMAG